MQMKYQVLGFQSSDTKNGCDSEWGADTLADAKREAKYMLSDRYAAVCESAKLATVQIWKGKTLIDQLGEG